MTTPDVKPDQLPSSGVVQPQPQPQPQPPPPRSATPDSNQPIQPFEDGGQQQQPPPPPFQPLFTLVTDSTGATHHPHVRYIFDDDDPDLLTGFLAHQQQQADAASSGSKSSNTPAHPNDRVIVLDLVPKPASTTTSTTDVATTSGGANGYQVAWASSLSADWAVGSAALAPMTGAVDNTPTTITTTTTSTAPSAERLMLRIDGVDLGSGSPALRKVATGSGSGSGVQQEDYNALIHEFDSRMAALRKVVTAGAERQAKLSAVAAAVAGAAPGGSPHSEAPVAGVVAENLPDGYGASSLPGVGHVKQQLDGGGSGKAAVDAGRPSGVGSDRVSDDNDGGLPLVQSERASAGSARGAERDQPLSP